MIFKNNSQFIIPLVIKKMPVSLKYIKDVYIETIGIFNFIVINTSCKIKESILEEDVSFYNVQYYDDGMIIRYSIPNTILYLCKTIMQCGYRALTKDLLFDCIVFWKDKSFLVCVNKESQAARESSLALFF